MYCKNCGEIIEEGERFCKHCGTSVDNVQSVENTINDSINPENHKKELDVKAPSKKKLVIGICIAIAVIAVLVGIFCLTAGRTKIDMKQVYLVQFDGYNNYATYKGMFDAENLPVIDGEKINNFKEFLIKHHPQNFDFYFLSDDDNIYDFVEVKLVSDKKDKLANGDVLSFEVEPSSYLKDAEVTLKDIEKNLGIKFKNDKFSVTVEGLQDAQCIDLMSAIESYIKYTSEGCSTNPPQAVDGYARPYLDVPNNVVQVGDFYFRFESSSWNSNKFYGGYVNCVYHNQTIGTVDVSMGDNKGLKTGDTVEIKIKPNTLSLPDGYVLPETEKQYTVPQLAKPMSADELIPAHKGEILPLLNKAVEEQNTHLFFKLGKIEKIYLAKRKPSSSEKVPLEIYIETENGDFVLFPCKLTDGTICMANPAHNGINSPESNADFDVELFTP